MVIVQLWGGIGNQMFQYACGRAVADKRKEGLVLFTGLFARPNLHRKYSLDNFNTQGRVVSRSDFFRDLGVMWMVREADFGFQSEVFERSVPNLILCGFWQSERYFEDISQTIRSHFAFTDHVTRDRTALALQMQSTESVCLHVRRGDYLLPADSRGFIGLEYYNTAIELVCSRIHNPFFYVFSDDIPWCATHLNIEQQHTFVRSGQQPDNCAAAELQLMSMCKHFIIANSTFSWWGAWLASSHNKVVVAPRRWFRHEPANVWDPDALQLLRSDDLIPSGWIRV